MLGDACARGYACREMRMPEDVCTQAELCSQSVFIRTGGSAPVTLGTRSEPPRQDHPWPGTVLSVISLRHCALNMAATLWALNCPCERSGQGPSVCGSDRAESASSCSHRLAVQRDTLPEKAGSIKAQ